MKQAVCTALKVFTEVDEFADLDYLDQFKDSTDAEEQQYYLQDQERKAAYERKEWWMISIQAEATIMVPVDNQPESYITQTIHSGGLYGIESDSNEDYKLQTAKDQINELKGYLKTLNVHVEGGIQLFNGQDPVESYNLLAIKALEKFQ